MSAKNIEQRRRVLRLKELGWSHEKIAEAVGLTRPRVGQLLAALAAEGDTYLAPARRGRHMAASRARTILESVLVKEPWSSGKWQIDDVDALLKGKGVELSKNTIYGILYRLGYRVRWVQDGKITTKESA
jgi:transposase